MGEFIDFIGNNLADFWTYTGFANATVGHLIMILVGLFFIYLAVAKEFEPMLLIPIGFGILVGNIPFNMEAGLQVGIYEQGSVLNILYQGVTSGWYPPLIFLGIGAMTDFSALISNPKLMLIGAAAQFGIFGAYMIALAIGFDPMQAAAIGIIGGADGPTAIFLSSKLAPNLMGAIAVSAYSYMALVPVIQPPVMRLLTTKHERLIRMKPPRVVSHTEKVMFPIIGLLLTCFLVPSGLPLLGMLFFGNLPAGSDGRCFHASLRVPYDRFLVDFRSWRGIVLHCHRFGRALREVLQSLPEERQQNQPAYRQRRRIRRARLGPYLADCRLGIRPDQLSADARHGSQRSWCNRFGCSCRYSAGLPDVSL